jgi:pimeloyl-ACP methyl ester carboxylesterase
VIFLVAIVALRAQRRRDLTATPFRDFTTQTLEIDGGWQIRYHRAGQGPHLLLIHGLGANLYCWRYIIPYLAPHFTVTAIDLPGFGQSSMLPQAHYGLDEQTARLQSFLDRLKIQKTYVAGNSMGGNIALWLALQHPERVLGLSVIAPATSPSLVPLALSKFKWLAKPAAKLLNRQAMVWAHKRTVSKKSLVDDDRVEETFRTYGDKAQAVESFLLATESIRDSRLVKALPQLTTKVLILWGSKDKIVNRQVIDSLESALQAAESHVHIGGGHHLQEDEPEWMSEKFVEFFTPKQD